MEQDSPKPEGSKKKKSRWWIPVVLFFGGVFLQVIVSSMNISSQTSGTTLSPIASVLHLLAIGCWILVIPSIILVVVLRLMNK